MKRWISIALIVVSLISFLILFNDEKVEQIGNMEKAQYKGINYMISIPADITNQPPNEIYNKITKVLNDFHGNIYYNRLVTGTNNTVKYTYFTEDEYFKNFILSKGRFLQISENDSEKFISTQNMSNPNQIGVIANFGQGGFFEIRTLKSMMKDGQPFNGKCNVQFNKNTDINAFVKQLSDSLHVNVKLIGASQYFESSSSLIYIVSIVSYFLIMLLVLYDIMSSYKKIGIQKMLGYSTKTIWLNKITSLILQQAVIFIVIAIVGSIFEFKDFNKLFLEFILKIILIDVILIGISFVVYSIPFIYVNKIKISDIVKNKQPVKAIMIANIIIKIIFMVFFVLFTNGFIQNFGRIEKQFTNSYQQWEKAKSYAVVSGYQNIDVKYSVSKEYKTKAKQIYEYFNKKGAILADFANLRPADQELNIKQLPQEWQRNWININPNYVKENPIYDIEGHQISISETEKDYMVLIPDKYRSAESEIRKYLDRVKNGYGPNDRVSKEEVKIIWIKSGQKLFSYNMDVNPNNGNMAVDALSRVITESNCSDWDYLLVALCSGNPFKIKVDNPINPAESILPKFSELKLDIYQPTINSAYDAVGAEIKRASDLEKYTITAISILLVIIVMIIMQNIYNYFEVNKQRLVIQQFHGYKKIDKYKSYFLLVLLEWVIIFNFAMLSKNIGILNILPQTSSVEFTSIVNIKNISKLTIALAIVEYIFSLVALTVVEKRKVINIIKGS